jgi:DNA-binding MarR family transcriptional regulator
VVSLSTARHVHRSRACRGELLGLDPNTVVDILDELEGGGLVTRHPNRQDRRRHGLRRT